MKRRFINNEKEFMLRLYFFETMIILAIIGIVLNLLNGGTSSLGYQTNQLALLISIGFNVVLDGKDKLFEFKRIKNNKE